MISTPLKRTRLRNRIGLRKRNKPPQRPQLSARTKRQPQTAIQPIEYIHHRELRRPGRVQSLLEGAETTLSREDGPRREDEGVLFKALHACGYALDHAVRGRFAGRTRMSLHAFRQRLTAELVNRNVGLIYDMRRRTRVAGVDIDDLMSEGMWTLYRAVVSFDPWRGFRFSTYACTSILRGFLMLSRRRQRQIDQIVRLGGEQENREFLSDRDPDLETQQQLDRLHRALATNSADLTATERFVIERRLLHNPGAKAETLQSIGELFVLSKERIRQIQVTAIDKLRNVLTREFEESRIQPGHGLRVAAGNGQALDIERDSFEAETRTEARIPGMEHFGAVCRGVPPFEGIRGDQGEPVRANTKASKRAG